MAMLKLTAEPPLDGVAGTTLAAIEGQLATADPVTLVNKGPDWIEEALIVVESVGGDRLTLESEPALEAHTKLASAKGLRLVRDLLQMRRPLPLGEPWSLEVRPFRPGTDDEQWLEVNNRAFSWHPDQGGWTPETLAGRMAEIWFDPDGFLVHDIDGRIRGFCWTKVHRDIDPAMGEIYVIGVDPDHGSKGLGRALLRAGLDHLAGLGLDHAFLYVESDNAPALDLYLSEGFEIHHHHRWWSADFR